MGIKARNCVSSVFCGVRMLCLNAKDRALTIVIILAEIRVD